VENLNAMIIVVGHIQVAELISRYPAWILQLAGTLAWASKGSREHASLIKNLDAVVLEIADGDHVVFVDKKRNRAIELPFPLSELSKRSQEFSVLVNKYDRLDLEKLQRVQQNNHDLRRL
jgi:hypothetical protein